MSQLTDNLFVLAPRKKEGRAEPGEGVVNPRRSGSNGSFPASRVRSVPDRGVMEELSFHKMISLERKRTERSRKPFLLMLLIWGPVCLRTITGRCSTRFFRLSRLQPGKRTSPDGTAIPPWWRHVHGNRRR